MANPQTQIERKIDELEEEVSRHKLAISIMTQLLTHRTFGLSSSDAARIEKILRGENEENSKDISDSLGEKP